MNFCLPEFIKKKECFSYKKPNAEFQNIQFLPRSFGSMLKIK